MKVEIIEEKEVKIGKNKFPHLGIYEESGRIVLFTSPETGVAMNGRSDLLFSTKWANNYELFTGKMILSND